MCHWYKTTKFQKRRVECNWSLTVSSKTHSSPEATLSVYNSKNYLSSYLIITGNIHAFPRVSHCGQGIIGQPQEAVFITSILLRRKPRHREVKELAQGLIFLAN